MLPGRECGNICQLGLAPIASGVGGASCSCGCVITDIHMPGSMDGLKLAHFVKDRWPPIKIIATSGHAKIAESDLPEGSRFLPKPYALAEIGSAIDQLIRQ